MIFLVFKWSLDEDYAIFKLQKTTPNYIFLESMWYVLSEFVCVIHGYMRVLCCHGNQDIYAENEKYLSEMTNIQIGLAFRKLLKRLGPGLPIFYKYYTITSFHYHYHYWFSNKYWMCQYCNERLKIAGCLFSEIYTLKIHRCLLPWQHLLLSWHNPPSSILARTRLL